MRDHVIEYHDSQGRAVILSEGIAGGSNKWGSYRLKMNGSLKRIVPIPVVEGKEKAKELLDKYAKKKKWKPYGHRISIIPRLDKGYSVIKEYPEEEKEADMKKRATETAIERGPRERKVADLSPYLGERDYDREVFIRETRYYLQMTLEGMIEAGRRLICLKEMEGHGRFLEALEEIGIDRYRSAELMAITQFMVQRVLPKCADSAHFKRYETMGKTRLLLLSRLPEDILKEYEESDEIAGMKIDKIQAMPLEELRSQVRELKDQVANGKKQVRRLQEKRDKLEKQLEEKRGLDGTLDHVKDWSMEIFNLLTQVNHLMGDELAPGREVFKGDNKASCQSCLRKIDAMMERIDVRWHSELKDKWGVE